MDSCSSASGQNGSCIDSTLAQHLKLGAIAVILVACITGVCMPLLGRTYSAFRPKSNLFLVMKSFAAGVILATGFVHMLPDAFDSLGKPCLAENPRAKFPFAGFISMVAALLTLMIDFWATAYYEKKHESQQAEYGSMALPITSPDNTNISKLREPGPNCYQNGGEDNDSNLSMVTVHAHASSQAISCTHPGVYHTDQHGTHSHSHLVYEESTQLRHRVISEVLEMGIIAHSVIIGITLGTSKSPCTIRPLLAALTFHQFFEGMALGGCLAQAGYKRKAFAVTAFFFSVTTPLGIAIGMGIASSYNENSPKALIVQGLFDSMSAGILVYISLVDLIAADFLSKKLQGDLHLQLYSYASLFLGAAAMSVIAYWA